MDNTETIIDVCIHWLIHKYLSAYVYTKHISKYGIHVHVCVVYIQMHTYILNTRIKAEMDHRHKFKS